MARATAAEVLKLFGGNYPPGTDATNIGNLCDAADYYMDGYAKDRYDAALSTTDTSVVHAANLTVGQLGMRILWYQAGGALSGSEAPPILTEEIKLIIDASMADTSSDDHATTLDAIDTSDT